MSVARQGVASTVLNGKLYAIGGIGLSSVEIFDPSTESWTAGVALPSEVRYGTAITIDRMIYLIGGRNLTDQDISQVLCFDPSSNQWQVKASMSKARHAAKLVWFDNRIWAIGGHDGIESNKVESYDPLTDSWQTEASLKTARNWATAWVTNGSIYSGGGNNGSSDLSSIEIYNPTTKIWSNVGILPEVRYAADTVVLNDKVYFIAGSKPGVYSNKVFAADLNASVAGIYDLYRKDGNASAGTPLVQAEVADGSVTAAKLAPEVAAKLDQNATIGSGSITKSMLANEVLNDLNKSLEDNSVTMAKLEPQLRADLNKTTARPFGASLANPYGILGTPITGTSYTVPSDKVLVITSSGSDVKVNSQLIRTHSSSNSVIPAQTTVTTISGARWTGYLIDPTKF